MCPRRQITHGLALWSDYSVCVHYFGFDSDASRFGSPAKYASSRNFLVRISNVVWIVWLSTALLKSAGRLLWRLRRISFRTGWLEMFSTFSLNIRRLKAVVIVRKVPSMPFLLCLSHFPCRLLRPSMKLMELFESTRVFRLRSRLILQVTTWIWLRSSPLRTIRHQKSLNEYQLLPDVYWLSFLWFNSIHVVCPLLSTCLLLCPGSLKRQFILFNTKEQTVTQVHRTLSLLVSWMKLRHGFLLQMLNWSIWKNSLWAVTLSSLGFVRT